MFDFFGVVFSPRMSGNSESVQLLPLRNLDMFLDTLNGYEKPSHVPSRDSRCKALYRYQYLLSILDGLKYA